MQEMDWDRKVGAGGTAPYAPLASLRARLLLLVVVALAPAFALTFWNHYQHLLNQHAAARASLMNIAHSRAFEFAEKINDTKSLLQIVAGFPTPRENPRSPHCSELLAGMQRALPFYANLGVATPEGKVVCSAMPFDPARPADVADRPWFRRALETRGFAIGDYLVGRLTGRHSLTFGHPVTGRQNELAGVAFAALDLSWLSRFVADLPLPPDSALVVIDETGRILARHPEHDAWVGEPHPQAQRILAAGAAANEGLLELADVDGMRRLGAWARVPGSTLTVFYGLPAAAIEAKAHGEFTHNLAFMAAILLLGFALACLAAERLVLRRTRRLSATADRLAEGDLAARSGIATGDEIGRLAAAFDHMATAVAEREHRLARANRALRVLSASNRGLLVGRSEQELIDTVCRTTVMIGGYPMVRVVVEGRETVLGAVGDPAADVPISLPLRSNGGEPGILEIHATADDAFDAHEIELLTEVADDLAFGIRTLRLRAQKAQAELLARENQQRLRFALEACDIGAWDIDLGDHTVCRSPEYDRIFGYPEPLAAWTLDDFFRHALPEYHDPIRTMVEEAAVTRTGWTYECRIRRADGALRWIWFTGRHYTDAAGHQRVAGVVVDITERKQAEAASAEAEAAQRANQMKSDFLASMSHELRTPLNAIIGFSEVLRDGLAGPMTAQQSEYLQDILESGTHLLSLINDILDLSKVEAGRMTLELETLSMDSALHTALTIVREKATAHRLVVAVAVAPDADVIVADARKLKQILYNLLSNAVKFTPDGGRIAVGARRVPADAVPQAAPPQGTAAFLEIAVTDTGIGIAAEDQARLFSAFTQIDSSLARQYQGTGLGLALVRRLAELHGGAAGLESAPGQGSTFRVWLPCRPTPADQPATSAEGSS